MSSLADSGQPRASARPTSAPSDGQGRIAWENLARICGAPILRGRIKCRAEDFQVIEELGFVPAGHGEHLWLRVRKTGANTEWVAGRIARWAGVRKRDVSFGGRKDRHAVVEQWFSCWLPGRADPPLSRFDVASVEILDATRHYRKLRAGAHAGNHFRLRVRHLHRRGDRSGPSDLDPESKTAGDRRAPVDGVPADSVADLERRIGILSRMGVPNYFGPQRFGYDNLTAADRLFAGEAIAQRGLAISAVRSDLFNQVLSARVRDGSWCGVRPDGSPATARLYGVGMALDPDSAETGILARFAGWCEGLEKLNVRAGLRARWVEARELRASFSAPDTLDLSFSLPAGAYATTLLWELLEPVEDRSHG